MKQKLALACALIVEPRILLLDEPTTGVDPVSRREFWDALAQLAAQGITILLATPYLDEAERCHRVALMHEGRLHRTGTPAALREELGLARLQVRARPPAGGGGLDRSLRDPRRPAVWWAVLAIAVIGLVYYGLAWLTMRRMQVKA